MKFDPLKKNNVTVTGNLSAPVTLVFGHGFGTDQTAWAPVTEAFKDEYRLVLYDNVGAGRSDPAAFSPNKYDGLHSYADDLIDICEALQLKDAIMIAHSVSGMISVIAAVKAPQYFSRMVLIGASPRYANVDEYVGGFDQSDLDGLYQAMDTNYFAWVSGFATIAMGNADKPHLAESFARTLKDIRPDIAQSVARVIFQSDHRNELASFDKETLLIQAREDIAVPLQVAQYLNRNIRNSRLVEVDATGHFPHISAPGEVIAAIKAFLN